MTKKKWIERIKAQLEMLKTTEPAYDPAIETLAAILEKRDQLAAKYKKDGSRPVIEYTNKAGATNMIKNPLLTMWDDLNKSALAYWRELGLTPSAYKKMTGENPKAEAHGGLAAALNDLGSA